MRPAPAIMAAMPRQGRGSSKGDGGGRAGKSGARSGGISITTPTLDRPPAPATPVKTTPPPAVPAPVDDESGKPPSSPPAPVASVAPAPALEPQLASAPPASEPPPAPAPPPQPPLLFEIAWEVCWQLGGIYTVLRSKAEGMVKRWDNRYCLIGPYNPQTAAIEFEEQPTDGVIREALDALRASGVPCHFRSEERRVGKEARSRRARGEWR